MSQAVSIDAAAKWLQKLQDIICEGIEKLDGGAEFIRDPWTRDGGGGGTTRVLTGGQVFEKATVNWSYVHGALDAAFAGHLPGDGDRFGATGVSLILHPLSPKVPAVHANVRVVTRGSATWFGGATDLTPYYPKEADAVHFHQTLRDTCQQFDASWYPRFKAWCDDYFYLPHRGEMRGVGGIFFDYLGIAAASIPAHLRPTAAHAIDEAVPQEHAYRFTQEVGRRFLEAYVPIVESRRHEPWTEQERQFQLYRRGRYVEFNLLYDRGTQFGLRTGGRAESILASLPPLARFTYDYNPPPGSPEARLPAFLQPRDWL